MLQFPAFMTQYPVSTRTIPTSYLLCSQWPQPQSEELLLAMEESDFEDKRKREISGRMEVVDFQVENLVLKKGWALKEDCNEALNVGA
ncbi:hypothetical protein DKX38_018714 [Salix brachista]|uniref:Uncharacterized protein n=1 Tax=Salix brachista TaxID=2182728 RepID=A0A5N5KNS4_9ROSI|nr:hypothetical protein DKX38_018714 [Salix brachista]